VTSPAEQPLAPRKGRSLTGFYIALGVVAALIGLWVALRGPIELRYAIYRLQHPAWKANRGDEYGWVILCGAAACRGNRGALEALMGRPESFSYWTRKSALFTYFSIAEAQPRMVVKVLRTRQDEEVISVLEDVCYGLSCKIEGVDYLNFSVPPKRPSYDPCLVTTSDEVWPTTASRTKSMLAYLDRLRLPKDTEDQQLVVMVSDLLRRRFAKELDEAEKVKAGEPTPPEPKP
jgi:hypothetical protein